MKINRTKTISKLIDELGYKKYIDEDVLKTIKNEGPKEGEIEFFTLGKHTTNAEVLKEYESRKLVPDMGAVISFLIENPKTLEEKRYIGMQMEDNVFAAFRRWLGEREVHVYRLGSYWGGRWWFGGRRKLELENSETKPSLDTETFEIPEILTINGIKYKRSI